LPDRFKADQKLKNVTKGVSLGIDDVSGKPVHCLMIFLVKKCFLMSSLILSWSSFEPFPCVLLLGPREKTSACPSPFPLLRKLFS